MNLKSFSLAGRKHEYEASKKAQRDRKGFWSVHMLEKAIQVHIFAWSAYKREGVLYCGHSNTNFFSTFWVLLKTSGALVSKPVPWGLCSHHLTSPVLAFWHFLHERQLRVRMSSAQAKARLASSSHCCPGGGSHWQSTFNLSSFSFPFFPSLLLVLSALRVENCCDICKWNE